MVAHNVDFIGQWFDTIPIIRRADKFIESILHMIDTILFIFRPTKHVDGKIPIRSNDLRAEESRISDHEFDTLIHSILRNKKEGPRRPHPLYMLKSLERACRSFYVPYSTWVMSNFDKIHRNRIDLLSHTWLFSLPLLIGGMLCGGSPSDLHHRR